jgi:DNA-binding response OmpR family regulator
MGFITPAGRSLLIVEEDVPLANFLSRELHASSFSVDLVYDGETAWSTLREQRRHDLLIVEAGSSTFTDDGVDSPQPR